MGLAYGILLGMASVVPTVCRHAYGAKQYAAMGIMCDIGHLRTDQRRPGLHGIDAGRAKESTGKDWARRRRWWAKKGCRGLGLCCVGRRKSWRSRCGAMKHGVAWAGLQSDLETGLVCLLMAVSLGGYWYWFTGIYIGSSPKCKETWTGFSWKAFTGMWPYFKLTIAFAIMLCLEIWYFQVLLLISCFLWNPTVSLESMSIWYKQRLFFFLSIFLEVRENII
ncbi:hypothetical protein M0R45_009620 [Rubus argutus]|uniref:Uncharacterized protein n=1 Tax=Rubus argutus TaxID=59490 RepID=A0AAW1Y6L9_RUBAR